MANFGGPGGSGNAFVNDGSFMEMFKRLQEQQKDKTEEGAPLEEKEDRSKGAISAADVERDTIDGSSNESEAHDKEKVSEKKLTEKITDNIDPPLVKASQGVMLGKRKALMKSIELREKRKRRREELEQEQQLAQQQDDKDKSSAWKAYMAQVKAYEAQNCTDNEGHRRPLVK